MKTFFWYELQKKVFMRFSANVGCHFGRQGTKHIFKEQDFCFYYMFKTSFLL